LLASLRCGTILEGRWSNLLTALVVSPLVFEGQAEGRDCMREEEIFDRFQTIGFEALTDEQPPILARFLEDKACASGLAAPLFLSQAIAAVDALFREHNEYGGIQIGFVRWLDHFVRDSMADINRADPNRAAILARKFRDEMIARVAGYSNHRKYDP